MENHYQQLRDFLFKTFIGTAFFLLGLQGFSQTQVNINKTGSRPDIEINLSQQANIPFFAQAKRARAFSLNSNIANTQGLQNGNKIRLQLFNDKDFPSTIVNKITDINGITSVTVKLDDFDYAFGYITVSEDSYLITIDIPEMKEKFTTRRNKENNTDFIFLLDESKMEKDEKCEPLLLNDNSRNQNPEPIKGNGEMENFKFSAASTSNDPATIDIMIVYTPMAEEWSDTYDGGINNTIATAMAIANTVASNSELGLNFNLVYSGLVVYTEQQKTADLSALRNNGDGLLDEVHDIRKNVGADMVVLFTNSSGGVAYLLNNKYGQSDAAFSVTGIASATSFTFSHELGHNMGIGHYKYQNVQPGNTVWSNWSENTWSGGWRWQSSDNNMYCDIMTYESGTYHVDGLYSGRVPYFSDPDREYLGGQTGDAVEGNGSRTMKEIKQIIASYSEAIAYCKASSDPLSVLYIKNISFGEISYSTGMDRYSDFSSLTNSIMPQETEELIIDIEGFGSKKQVLVWVDWNDDKVFDPLTELAYSSTEDLEQFVAGITVPLNVPPGPKRMRIRLNDLDSGSNELPCGNSIQGEVEDYTINVETPVACEVASIPGNIISSDIQDYNFTVTWEPVTGIDFYELRFQKAGTTDWTNIKNIVYPFHKITNLEASTEYEVQVRSICAGTPSDYSNSIFITAGSAATSISFFSQPAETQAGRVIDTVKVELLDVFGNRSASTAEVTLSLVDNDLTGAILSGTLTVEAKNGLATFTDLKVDNEGNFKLQAQSEELTLIESENYSITPYEQVNFIVTSTANDGPGTLREAITLANKSEVTDLITFQIEGQGPHRIQLTENLPAISQTVVLNATSQPNYIPGSPQIIIDGSNVPLGTVTNPDIPRGFYLIGNSSGSSIRGFVIGGFGLVEKNEDGELLQYSSGYAFYLIGTGQHSIQANFIGVSEDGMQTFSNGRGMYFSGGSHNLIGGLNPGEGNIISGNGSVGILIGNESTHNKILSNYFGTSADGTIAVGNSQGLAVSFPSFGNHIEGNVFSGNGTGLVLSGGSNYLYNNYIGVDPTGDLAIPNENEIRLTSENNIIGATGKGNIISGNKENGIYLASDASKNTIQDNLIGTDKNGVLSIPNNVGIYISNIENLNNLIGGANEGEENIISGNLSHGIHITSTRFNTISGNYIGLSKDGLPLGNGGDGIHLSGSYQTTIGGEEGKPNLIAFNGGAGVAITEYGNNNKISQNSIYFNSSLGIDLDSNGSTANDRDDRDNGPNNFQNSPELITSAALEGSVLQLEYLVNSVPQYSAFPIKVEFFKSDGNGQGKEYLGTDIYTENDISKGRKGKMISLQLVQGSTLNGGDKVLATATDAVGNTSEFGAEVDVTGGCTEAVYYADADADGLGDLNKPQTSCNQPDGYVNNSDDCDDTNAEIGAGPIWYADSDGDGFGDPEASIIGCTQPDGYIANSDDCNDSDPAINPASIDVCSDCDPTNDSGCEIECLGTDILYLAEVCTDGSTVQWIITNPGTCTVDVRWELRKREDSGNLTVPPGDSYFTSGVASKGSTQITIYWNASNGIETKTNANASGISCTSSSASIGEETIQDSDPAVKVYPNPLTSEGIWLHFAERIKKTQFKIVAYDLSGLKMAETVVSVDASGNDILWKVDHSSWIQGIYILNVSSGNEIHQIKIIK